MKIPGVVHGRNKVRDAKILSMYVHDSLSAEEIARQMNLTESRIFQIVYRNRHLVAIDRNYEKLKRINHLKRILAKKSEVCMTKDAVDILDKLRIECESDSDERGRQSGETKVIIIRDSAPQIQKETSQHGNQNQNGDVPRSVSLLRI